LSRTVVMVAVDTRERVAIASGVRDIENSAPVGFIGASSCGVRPSRQVGLAKGCTASYDHVTLSRAC